MIVYTVDGKEYFHHEGDTVPAKDELVSIFASLMAGGDWMGEFPDATTPLPARMEIDYIRVYDQSCISRGNPATIPRPNRPLFQRETGRCSEGNSAGVPS